MQIHKSITDSKVTCARGENSAVGFCISCGYEDEDCEVGEQTKKCSKCGESTVHHSIELAYHLPYEEIANVRKVL